MPTITGTCVQLTEETPQQLRFTKPATLGRMLVAGGALSALAAGAGAMLLEGEARSGLGISAGIFAVLTVLFFSTVFPETLIVDREKKELLTALKYPIAFSRIQRIFISHERDSDDDSMYMVMVQTAEQSYPMLRTYCFFAEPVQQLLQTLQQKVPELRCELTPVPKTR